MPWTAWSEHSLTVSWPVSSSAAEVPESQKRVPVSCCYCCVNEKILQKVKKRI